MRIGGSHDKNGMGRRLLQGFEEGVKGILGETVNLINDKNLLSPPRREIFNIFPKFPNLLYAPVTGAINFQDIKTMTLGDLQTGLTPIAGRRRWTFGTVQGLGQNAGDGGLPNAPGAAEKKGVGNPTLFQGIF